VSGEASPMDGKPRLKVGHLEGSNVAVPREMTDLMQNLRAFEAVQRLMTSYDDQLGSAIQRLSEF
jgi:flagellar basal body rod protein FlgG